MPVGGGDPKILGDGTVVYLRPDATRGGADVWELADALVAVMEELDLIYADAVAAADGNAFRVALAARGGRTVIQLLDRADAP